MGIEDQEYEKKMDKIKKSLMKMGLTNEELFGLEIPKGLL